MEYKDYYQMLDLDQHSPADEIKKAYRKLARRYHPDINPGDEEAARRYKDINEAHLVLINPEARAKYDRLGATWQAHQDAGNDTDFDWRAWLPDLDPADADVDLDELLARRSAANAAGYSSFFALIFTGIDVGEGQLETGKGQDYHQKVEITLEEAFGGTSRILRVGGRRLEVRIPKGADTGTKVRVRGEGGVSIDGESKGDLYLEIEVTQHAHFQRTGDDLHLDLPVNVYSAVLGGEVIVPTLKGKIKLKVAPETQSGRIFRLKGQGMPNIKNPEERGDLYAKVMITVPENLTDEEIELFEELADIRGL